MSDKAKQKFPLDKFSEAETDEEFGLPEFKEHFADTLTPAVLREWTAQDFASIYVRFRPHLERHAKRFLVNPSQVEEVVQDAFLYLMTTLPELDSELGVLKFLKWKVRLLSLDVIRASSRAVDASNDRFENYESTLPEVSQSLEKADDAAIVMLALSKLQPRQRQALVASILEEKSSALASQEMGISENAFRQLLFRSRKAFKKALVGEAEVAGLSTSQILSIAVRKAAVASAKASVVLALLSAVSLTSIFTEDENRASTDLRSSPPLESADSKVLYSDEKSEVGYPRESFQETPFEIQAGDFREQDAKEVASGEVSDAIDQDPVFADNQPNQDPDARQRGKVLELALLSTLDIEKEVSSETLTQVGEKVLLQLNPEGYPQINLGLLYSGSNASVDFISLVVAQGEYEIVMVPRTATALIENGPGGVHRVSIAFADLIAGDTSGSLRYAVAESSELSVRKGVIKFAMFEGALVGDATIAFVDPS